MSMASGDGNDVSSPSTTGDWEAEPAVVLRRWQEAGALWRVLFAGSDVTVIGLYTCDGGEETARVRCASDVVDGFLQGRVSSDQAHRG